MKPDSIVHTVWATFLATAIATSTATAPDSNTNKYEQGVLVTADTPFYTLAGDLVHAAWLSALYYQSGIGITIETLIEYPTQRAQRGLLGGLL